MARTIIHLDLDAFYCAVEEGRDPALRGVAFAVGGPAQSRGVVASCSYAARRFGVRSAMPMGRAAAQCPGLVVVPPHFDLYRAASRQVMRRLRAVTPLVEQISIDEAFLDVTEVGEPGRAIAKRLQAAILQELGLPCSLGVATNKLVAKIGSDAGKARIKTGQSPQAICVVPPGEEAAFLAPLPVGALWGVGPKTRERLEGLGMRTIGDIAAWPVDNLVRRFGKHGLEMARHANGIDNRLITTERVSKSISKETTFQHDIDDGRELRNIVVELALGVARQLRRERLSAATVKLKLRRPDFTTLTRQVALPERTDKDAPIRAAAVALFDQSWTDAAPLRLVGVGVSNLGENFQLRMWDEEQAEAIEREQKLRDAVDGLENRFGEGTVRLGRELE